MHNYLRHHLIVSSMFIFFCVFSYPLMADEDVITDDGREVRLKADGTWEFISDNRYANTKSGSRVRLKGDKTWEYIGFSPMASKDQVKSTLLDIKLDKVVIKVHKKRMNKNKRIRSQTFFHLTIDVTPLAKTPIQINKNSKQLITITDSKQDDYPVILLSPSKLNLAPGSKNNLVVVAEGAPQWIDAIRAMNLVFSPGAIGNEKTIKLSYFVNDISRIKVDKNELVEMP